VICPNCGKNTPEGKFCENCGASLQTPQTFQQPAVQQPAVAHEEKNVVVALILSLFFTGSGQVYNGETGKGIGILIAALIGYMLFIIPGVLVVLYGLYDAYTTAQKMNKGEIPFKPASMGIVIAFIVAEIIIAMLFFFIAAAAIMSNSYNPYYNY
jgi:TM2 domain-containing membrane protein YozV